MAAIAESMHQGDDSRFCDQSRGYLTGMLARAAKETAYSVLFGAPVTRYHSTGRSAQAWYLPIADSQYPVHSQMIGRPG